MHVKRASVALDRFSIFPLRLKNENNGKQRSQTTLRKQCNDSMELNEIVVVLHFSATKLSKVEIIRKVDQLLTFSGRIDRDGTLRVRWSRH